MILRYKRPEEPQGNKEALTVFTGKGTFTPEATSETINPESKRRSKTWNFEAYGRKYRVQIQETDPSEEF